MLRTCIKEHAVRNTLCQIKFFVSLIEETISKHSCSNILFRFRTNDVFNFSSYNNQSLIHKIEFNFISKRIKLSDFKIKIFYWCWLSSMKFSLQVFIKCEITVFWEFFLSELLFENQISKLRKGLKQANICFDECLGLVFSCLSLGILLKDVFVLADPFHVIWGAVV